MFCRTPTLFIVAGIGLCSEHTLDAANPRVLKLQTQTVKGRTYFHVRLERPADLQFPTFDRSRPFSEVDRRNFARLPRLVSQDNQTRAVYYRHKPTRVSLSFYGQVVNRRKARLLLRYPTKDAPAPEAVGPKAVSRRPSGMAEVAIELDFTKAQEVAVRANDPADQHIYQNDLLGLWALSQAAHFAVLETQVLDFPFYSFAREASGRKYNVMSPAWVQRQIDKPQHRLYEITTGADAITETLQLHRLLKGTTAAEKRSIPLSKLVGVTVPPQPWKRLLANKKPQTEAIAQLIPHDNYYLSFRSFRKFLEIEELMDQWGTNVIRAYEMKSRDSGLRERYEEQLCLRSTVLGKVLGPALVTGLAITGNDPYVREGTDVTVIFHVANRHLFLAAVEGFLNEARRKHGRQLVEKSEKYHETTIETFVTPLREVSLHRVALGDFVVYSNSPVGVRRVIDAQAGRIERLADSGGFRYMRTVFAAKDKAEHGFAFLPDAFIRRFMGPASRIKEKRRLEALTSLSMLTNAALFCAWETGKLPADHTAAMDAAGLRPTDIAVPEGKGAIWDAKQKLAVSDVYNTMHFATPLVELPIDKVTPAEAAEYKKFRDQYTRLWRTYFDPIALRLTLDKKQVRVETHILPLVGRTRLMLGTPGATLPLVPRSNAIVHFQAGLSKSSSLDIHLDKTPLLEKMLALLIRGERGSGGNLRKEYDQLFWKLPFGLSFEAKDELPASVSLDEITQTLRFIGLAGTEKPQLKTYKGISYHRLKISENQYRKLAVGLTQQPQPDGPFATILALLPTTHAPEALYFAFTKKSLYVSFNEAMIKKQIDRQKAPKKPKVSRLEADAALFIAPDNARKAAERLFEYESHRLSLLNNDVWNCFYQTGLVKPGTDSTTANKTVRKFLGYIPVSADGSLYRYDARRAEIVSQRHGSASQPIRHSRIEATSEPGKLLARIKSLRIKLRIQNNGLYSVLTIERR